MLAEIIPQTKSYKSDVFSYLVPTELTKQLAVGSIVQIPFGKKIIRGVVKNIVSERDNTKLPYEVKEILAIENQFSLPACYLPIIMWIADHYLCTQGEAMSLFLPPQMKRPPKNLHTAEGKVEFEPKLKKLSDSQNDILKQISSANGKKHLIYGVTGSGKTEVYIHLCQKVLSQNKSCVILVPEIMLTPQTVERFVEAFGENITLIHSNLSQGERYKAYQDFHTGQKKIIIGPRSALLVPNNNIGLIIIDEEHEEAYKQDKSPRYHAVDLAEKIAEQTGAELILGSATPRMESFYKAKSGIYQLHELKTRYNKLLLPPAETVDLKNELRSGNNSLLSERLERAISETLADRKQVLLFLNRRGSSTFVSCRDCGEVVNCANCHIPLIHHQHSGFSYLFCHHCGFRGEVPIQCPNCRSPKIKFFGAGVEKVEMEVSKLFPKAKIRRIDASSMGKKSDYDNFYQDFKNHKIDIAIGTQMLSKGLDIPGIDLVGIVSADTGLHLPFFRSSEKSFRLITQVSGRSGRTHNPGRTIIQTYWPESNAILLAAKHDYLAFYESEISQRAKHRYPPFYDLIRVVSEHQDQKKALAEISKIIPELEKQKIDFIGPGPCFFQRLRDKYRYHLIIKLNNEITKKTNNFGSHNSESVTQTDEESLTLDSNNNLRELWKNNLNLIWDVDPVDLL